MTEASNSFTVARGLIASALDEGGRAPRAPSALAAKHSPSRYPFRPAVRAASTEGRLRLLLGVSTMNRQKYLRRFIESFAATFDRSHDWTLVVADDGSTDGTLEYLRTLAIGGCTVVVIENEHITIAGQTNSILATTLLVAPDLAFKADDDVFFTSAGWENLYLEATRVSDTIHLIYHNRQWKAPTHDISSGTLHSSVAILDTMGCFYSFTPRMIEEIGYFDEVNFPVRGHAHIDWSMRAARAGFTNADTAWDAGNSEDYIGMWQIDDYIELMDWDSPAMRGVIDPKELARRMAVINRPERISVPHSASTTDQRVAPGSITPSNPELAALLAEHRIAEMGIDDR